MKVLFIGTGVITYAHADGLKLIGSEPSACYDIFKPSAERFAKTYGCEALDDYKEYLDRERPDYVLICTPPVGTSLFICAKTANITIEEMYKAILPFLIPLIIVLLMITYIPGIVTWLPSITM